MTESFYIIITGCLVGSLCSLVGTFLILRKMSMIGDAISHSILPGIVIAFLVTQSRGTLSSVLGAVVIGLFTTAVIEFFSDKGKLYRDASIGVTFTSFFSIGVILITLFSSSIDLDLDCVLFGEMALIPFNLLMLPDGGHLGPIAFWTIGGALIINLIFIFTCFKPLVLTSFDPNFAETLGIKTSLWNYSLMLLVSLVTVVCFEAVGSVLVVAFLVIPPATAYLLTKDIKVMLPLSVVFGIVSTTGGFFISDMLDNSISATMVVVSGALFLGVLFFSGLNFHYVSARFRGVNLPLKSSKQE